MHDFVIVGGGSAGCVLAARLSEDPATSVLLLEAGPPAHKREIAVPAAFPRLFGSEIDWGYSTVPQAALAGREILFPRGRVVGGSGSMNAMIAIHGHRLDHERWPAGWSWADVAPAYERSRSAAGVTHRTPYGLSAAFIEASVANGIRPCPDLSSSEPDGVGMTPVTIRSGRRWSTADGYLRPAVGRPNLEVRTGAHATRILAEGGRAVGVAYRVDGAEVVARARREILLTAGAIDTPKLLLLSGIGPAAELHRHGIAQVLDLPGVGRGLRDHLAAGVLVATRPGVATLADADRLRHVARWLLTRTGPLTSNVGEAAAFVRSDPALAAPDLELLFAPVPFEEEGRVRPTYAGFTVAAVLLDPVSTGSVTLASADPVAPPRIDPRYLSDAGGEDLRRLLHGARLARRIAHTGPLADLAAEEMLPGRAVSDDDLAGPLREHAQTLYHPVGTCRMGKVSDGAVVDVELRVHGLGGLRIADASVMPSLPRGHTNWPTVMIAERAAEILRSQP